MAATTAQQENRVDAEELERELLVRMPGWIWGSWECRELYGVDPAQHAQGG